MALTKNMGRPDKLIRLGVVIILTLLVTLDIIPDPYGFILLGVAVVLLITSFLNFCPLYTLFGINTCKVDK